jgi:hypothetical protein
MTTEEKAREINYLMYEDVDDEYIALVLSIKVIKEILKVAFYTNQDLYDFYTNVRLILEEQKKDYEIKYIK